MPDNPEAIMTATVAPPRTLLTPIEAASYLTVKVQTLANWRVDGKGPKYVHVGRLIRYRLADLERWIAKS